MMAEARLVGMAVANASVWSVAPNDTLQWFYWGASR